MLLPLYQHPLPLPSKTSIPVSYPSFPTKNLIRQNPSSLKSTKKPLIQSSLSDPKTQTLPQSAIQRIAEKLRSLGFTETQRSKPELEPEPESNSAGEIFVPLPKQLPKFRVGHSIDTSWSTPENPVPEPGSDAGSLMVRFREMQRERKVWRRKEDNVPTLAELSLPEKELKRLRTLGIGLKKKLKIGKAGITEGIVSGIHERWRRSEVVKIACEDICRMNMKRTHDVLERKTGGLVVWRSGTKIILYRGANYKYPYFSPDKISSNASPGTTIDNEDISQTESCSSDNRVTPAVAPSLTKKVTGTYIQGVSPDRVRFQLPGEAELVEEADRLLDGLGPRFTDWWGYEPLPVDGDLLPATVPGYRRPFRLLPYGVKQKLTNDEMTTLRRLGRPLPCHFVLGRNRKLQGLAASILKLWEKCEIAKIAVKRGVQNTNSELMAEELKWLTGGTLLARDKDFIVLYRGKDFLPSAVSSAIEERRNYGIHGEKRSEDNGVSSRNIQEPKVGNTKSGSLNEVGEVNDHRSSPLDKPKNLRSDESAIERTSIKLSMAFEKKAKAEKLLAELEKAEIPEQSEIDKEGITEEERYMLRKVGLRMKPFLLLGRRGVFDGTIENMHLHWKYREIVKIISKDTNVETVHQVARILEAESGGILVAVERVSKGYAIIVYRGKNYQRPTSLRPRTLLTKRQAMKRSLEEQRQKSLKLHILKLTRNIDELKNQMVKGKGANNMQLVDELRLPLVKEETKRLESAECSRANMESNSVDWSHSVAPGSCGKDEGARDENGADSNSMDLNETKAVAMTGHQTTEQELIEHSLIHHRIVECETKSQSTSESTDKGTLAAEMKNLGGEVETSSSPSYPDKFLSKGVIYSAAVNARHHVSDGEPSVESANSKLDVSFSPVAENVSSKMASRAIYLSNKDRLLLRKKALNMKKRPVLAVGRSNIVTGVAKAIKAHFEKHPLAIVNVKGRAKGTSVQEVVLKLEEATGAVLVSQEPSKVILYRGWGAGIELGKGDKKNATGAVNASSGREAVNRPAVSPELIAAIKLECGLQSHVKEEATS